MDFEYTKKILKDNIHGHPKEKQDEVNFVLRMLEDGCGYLRKEFPKQIIFFNEK